MELTPEDGTPSVSYENIYKVATAHGPIVAVSHLITPDDNHVTKVFFFDNASYTAYGFAMGFKENPKDTNNSKRFAKCLALLMIVNRIWGIDSLTISEKFWASGHGDDVKEAFEKDQNVVFNFIAPDSTALTVTLNSDEIVAFDQSNQAHKEDKNDVRTIE